MIIVRLIGGLGNQMFQYAAARALAARHKTDVKVDVSYLEEDPGDKHIKRDFELHIFTTEIKMADKNELASFTRKSQNRIERILPKFLFEKNMPFHATEHGSLYNEEFKKFPANTFLEGFWQSEKYIRGYEDLLRKEFTFKPAFTKIAEEWRKKIHEYSISLHVRRGDYVNNPQTNTFHGVCSLDYYDRAVNYISKSSSRSEVFIFSDDISWCKQNFKFEVPVHYVDLDNAPAELYLMSQCNHNFLANSSFSWWGAWLNNHKNKIVVAPDKWFQSADIKTDDIYCKGWVRM